MREQNAQKLLAKVMGWQDEDTVLRHVPILQLLADYKYDEYKQFGPGKRFIESLALWLNQFTSDDRETALNFVMEKLVFFSDEEFTHLVQMAYPDVVVQERIRLVAEELGIPPHRVGKITRNPRFEELRAKSLYLGLSDGARTNELRRASNGGISNEQIWQAYELGDDKAKEMLKELQRTLENGATKKSNAQFTQIWLLDDFSGSGNTYIRYDSKDKRFKGKLKKIYDRLHDGDFVDTMHYEVYLLLYVATRQAIDHIEYWAERFTSSMGYKPLQVRVLCPIEREVSVGISPDEKLLSILGNDKYYDARAADKHFLVGGTDDPRLGFAGCALPLVLSHNTPNNSVSILWGFENHNFPGLFPRVSRHREF